MQNKKPWIWIERSLIQWNAAFLSITAMWHGPKCHKIFGGKFFSVRPTLEIFIKLHEARFFEPTCAYARWALMHHFLSVCDVTKIHIWGTAWHMALKFGQGMGMDDLEVDPEGQGHRSKVKVIWSKNVISGLIFQARVWHTILKFGLGMDMDDLEVDPRGQGQRSRSPGQKTG